MDKKSINQNVGWFLAFAGVSSFLVSLIHPKSRGITKKVVGIGGGLAIDYAVTNYLPRISQGIIKIIMRNSFSTKGGIAKKRYFKKKIF